MLLDDERARLRTCRASTAQHPTLHAVLITTFVSLRESRLRQGGGNTNGVGRVARHLSASQSARELVGIRIVVLLGDVAK